MGSGRSRPTVAFIIYFISLSCNIINLFSSSPFPFTVPSITVYLLTIFIYPVPPSSKSVLFSFVVSRSFLLLTLSNRFILLIPLHNHSFNSIFLRLSSIISVQKSTPHAALCIFIQIVIQPLQFP